MVIGGVSLYITHGLQDVILKTGLSQIKNMLMLWRPLIMGELNTFLLGIISILMTLQVGMFVKLLSTSNAHSKAITEILTRCNIFHDSDGHKRRFTDNV